MPTITDKKNEFPDQDASQILRGAGGSPEGETTAPPRSVRERLPSEVRGLLSDELIAARVWRTHSQLELAIVAYVGWFNNQRLHESLGDIPPAEHELLHEFRYAAASH